MAADTVAVLADVHGNALALEAVLEDIDRRSIRNIVNLGDSLYGPLDPAGAVRMLRRLDIVNIRGNQDRAILEAERERANATMRFVLDTLTDSDVEWLAAHRPTATLFDGAMLLCHGTPDHDDRYLIESVGETCVSLRPPQQLGATLDGVTAEMVACGHSHVPRTVALPDGRLIVNPGSVGLPAYTDDAPFPHAMEAGSPHARYGVVARDERGWRVEHVAVSYDWEGAARQAEAAGRGDWARWIRSGRA